MRTAAIGVTLWCCMSTLSAHELEGTWRFEKETNTRADGSAVQVPGPAYEGVLIYTADGHVSATVMPRNRRWNVDSATRDELHASVAEGSSTAYAGRYEVDDLTHTVTHIPAVSIDPADIGSRLKRNFEITGDRLKLSGKWKYQGQELTFTVTWVRDAASRPSAPPSR